MAPAVQVAFAMHATGRILAVQEQRFRFETDDGQVLLLTLARGAALDNTELCRLQEQRTRVTLDYAGEPNLKGCVARSLHRAR